MRIFSDDTKEQLLRFTVAAVAVSDDYAIEEHTLKVEEELLLTNSEGQRFDRSSFFGQKYVLQRIALAFLENSCRIYSLGSQEFPEHPGVYLIYHVGEIQLYEGSQISPSTRYPVYVGMSETTIAARLEEHCRIIKKGEQLTETLEMTDFVVRFMIVDNKYYARPIEGMLIEYFNPVWNSETRTMRFSFGSVKTNPRRGDPGADNVWYKYHILKDLDTIEDVLDKLKIE